MSRVENDARRLHEAARAWLQQDPDPATRRTLAGLIAREALGELAALFAEPLHFGTSGIRGPLGPGPSRMNLATVRRVSAALAAQLLALPAPTPGARRSDVPPLAVIGRDARHGSECFAAEAARVLSGAGLRVLRLPRALPTPVLAFAVRELRADSGVMLTASHNPPCENGMKIYARGGAQIVEPFDEQIAQRMRSLGDLREVPLGDEGEQLDDELLEAYIARVAALDSSRPAQNGARHQPRVIYTPLHGVGAAVLTSAFPRCGRPVPELLASQADPDPDFPTLERPNPEEPAALSLALEAARDGDFGLLLANDPDADRLAVAIPEAQRRWRILSGDEIGALLADHMLRRAVGAAGGLLVSTVASSTLLAHIAREAGAPFAQTLTGFKWIMRAPDALSAPHGVRFGYEEALGYAVSDAVRDKDGISAALALVACAEDAALEGRTLADRLAEIAKRFGLHATRQLSVRLEGGPAASAAREAMDALRERPPRELAGARVDWSEDLIRPAARAQAGTLADRMRVPRLPPANVLLFGCGERVRVVVRPSGTEPKLKLYLQVVEQAGDPGPARVRASARLDELERALRALLQDVTALQASA